MIIEIIIYTAFIIFLFFYVESSARALSLFGFLASSTVLEIMNLTVFHNQGTRYPETLFYFPGYRFPVAIVLFSAIYGGIICLISLKIINFLNPKVLKKTFFLFTAAALNISSIFVEKAGVMSGYWVHEKAKDLSDISHFIYLFYFTVVLGGIVFLFDEIRKKN